MTKLKVLAVTALASTAAAVGTLASAPSASAEPATSKTFCELLGQRASEAGDTASYWLENWGPGGLYISRYWSDVADKLSRLYIHYCA